MRAGSGFGFDTDGFCICDDRCIQDLPQVEGLARLHAVTALDLINGVEGVRGDARVNAHAGH